ncbi:MAG: methyltransferase [Desulforegulaceae bacterium]|nr:methyltransferase [Desulforegulaceae bacterium]
MESEAFELMEKSFAKFMDNIFEEEKILRIEEVLIKLSFEESVFSKIKEAQEIGFELIKAQKAKDIEKREMLLINLYLLFHKYGAGYSFEEEKFMEKSKGLKWLPGGLMPLVLGSYLMKPEYEFCDLGCGNGFQGILMQALSPHSKTRQVEISKNYLEAGRIFLKPLKIDKEKISFENTDISNFKMKETDFVYMYRPSRPMGEGAQLYRNLSNRFYLNKKSFYLLSVADCFEPFIKGDYEKIYQNEYLSIFYFNRNFV